MYEAVQSWERAQDQKVDFVLQAGDMGIFPDLNRLDSATRRFGREDPTELLASLYVEGKQVASHSTFFVRGNHEDQEFLSKIGTGAVDPAGKIVHLGGAFPVRIGGEEKGFSVVTLGGIEPRVEDPLSGWYSGGNPKYFDQREVRKLLNLPSETIDILLTHDGPKGYCFRNNPVAGSLVLLEAVKKLQPRFHFFGHYQHSPAEATLGRTRIVPLNRDDVYTLPNRDGGMGILDTASWTFEFVTERDLGGSV
jgi:Icc-related predicted phosphoesterase